VEPLYSGHAWDLTVGCFKQVVSYRISAAVVTIIERWLPYTVATIDRFHSTKTTLVVRLLCQCHFANLGLLDRKTVGDSHNVAYDYWQLHVHQQTDRLDSLESHQQNLIASLGCYLANTGDGADKCKWCTLADYD